MTSIAAIASADARFNILINALTYIDSALPGSNLVATLSSASADVTVFAPTDSAFGRLAQDLGFAGNPANEAAVTSFLVGALPATTLRDVVLYHVSAGGKTLAEIAGLTTVQTLNGATITPDGNTLVDLEPDLINPALVQTDIIATNGVIHAIDRVLLPFDLPGNDAPTITGLVAASGTFDGNRNDFDLLLNAVTAAGLAGALDDRTADLTVFAPNDAAFLRLATTLGFTGTGEQSAFNYLVDALTLLSGGNDPIPLLTNILLYHVAPESLQSSQVLALDQISTLLGVDVGRVGTRLVDGDPDLANPRLIATDIQAANGVVHVIDNVLIPVNLLRSDGSNDVDFVIAGNGADRIATGADRDLIDGNGGGDLIFAGSGDDTVLGGSGRDHILAGSGNDLVRGGDHADLILGGLGRDRIAGERGNDKLFGGADRDTFVFAAGDGRDVVGDFRNGQDRLDLSAYDFASFAALKAHLTGNQFSTTFTSGSDSITLVGLSLHRADASDFIL
jgi:uncharacterized surface protein with fasciclin (FAS1) repeats